jgi:hypothetical protein
MSKVKRSTAEKNVENEVVSVVPEDEIAQRAYELYLARGGQHGHDLEDWFEAEKQLREDAAAAAAA